MAKLLIADDEIFTIDGIINGADWPALGIDAIEQAVNGVKALEIALSFKPDIILSDIRMPKMDGIEFVHKYREIDSDCAVIFMSSYSDKNYLRNAIKLRAISYVEKPIILEEIIESVKNALKTVNERREMANLRTNTPKSDNELALLLTRKSKSYEKIYELARLVDKRLTNKNMFVTLLLKTVTEANGTALIETQGILNAARKILTESEELQSLSVVKNDVYSVIHMYATSITDKMLSDFCEKLLQHTSSEIFISIGQAAYGIEMVYESYNTALLAMHTSFFRRDEVVFCYNSEKLGEFIFDKELIKNFRSILIENNFEKIDCYIRQLTENIRLHKNSQINSIKNIFYNLLLEITTYETDMGFAANVENTSTYIWDIIAKINSLNDLQSYLLKRVESATISSQDQDSSGYVTSKIRGYVYKEYYREDLSIEKISKYLFLTPSYICKIFKEKTGVTINQYLTDYRIGKAKDLLKDRNLKVSEIAASVGYNDSKYFAKLFQKHTGFKPTEFREKFCHE